MLLISKAAGDAIRLPVHPQFLSLGFNSWRLDCVEAVGEVFGSPVREVVTEGSRYGLLIATPQTHREFKSPSQSLRSVSIAIVDLSISFLRTDKRWIASSIARRTTWRSELVRSSSMRKKTASSAAAICPERARGLDSNTACRWWSCHSDRRSLMLAPSVRHYRI